jgi:hypothetical protein
MERKMPQNIQKCYRTFDERLSSLPRQRLIVLMVITGLLFAFLGGLLGVLIVPRNSASSNSDSNAPQDDSSEEEETSHTGVLREFLNPENGIELYLEKADGSQILLDLCDRFDPDFVKDTYVGTVVTVKGEMGKSADGYSDVFSVEEIVIKR